jgi:hypothetical protein
MGGLTAVCKVQMVLRKVPMAAVGVTVKNETVGVMAQPVERGRREQAVLKLRFYLESVE